MYVQLQRVLIGLRPFVLKQDMVCLLLWNRVIGFTVGGWVRKKGGGEFQSLGRRLRMKDHMHMKDYIHMCFGLKLVVASTL